MNPLYDLKKLLLGSETTSGTVASISGEDVIVATGSGPVVCKVGINVRLSPGDGVTIKSGTITGKLKPVSEVPRFFV